MTPISAPPPPQLKALARSPACPRRVHRHAGRARGLGVLGVDGRPVDGNDFVEAALAQGAAHIVSNRPEWQDELGSPWWQTCWTRCKHGTRPAQNVGLSRVGPHRQQWKNHDQRTPARCVGGRDGGSRNLWELQQPHRGALTLLRAPAQPEFVVVEMGANHQQEIALLCAIAEPSHGCITNIGLAHLEGFGGKKGCTREEGTVRPSRGHTRHGLRQHGRPQSGTCCGGRGSESPHLARRLDVDPSVGDGPTRRQPEWRLLWCAP